MVAASAIFSFTFAYGDIFHSVIRYEFAGVLWFSLALLSTLYALETGCKLFILISGFCAGWAFISKIVLLPSFLIPGILFILLRGVYSDNPLLCSKKERKQTLILSALYAGVLLIALIFVGVVMLRRSFDSTALDAGAFLPGISWKRILVTGALFPLFIAAQLFVAAFLYKKYEEFHSFAYYFHRLVLFSFSFFLPMVFILFQSKGLHIFVNVYIFSFALGQASMFPGDVSWRVSSNFSPMNIGIFLLLLAIGGSTYFYALKKNKNFQLSLVFLFLGGIHLLHLIFLRGNEAGLPLYNIFIILSAMALITYKQFFCNHKVLWAGLCIVLMLVGTAYVGQKIIVNSTAEPLKRAPYYYSLTPWYTHAYNERAALYTEALADTYQSQENWEKAFFWSRDIRNTRQLLRSLQGNPNRLQDSALIFPGSKLSPRGETLNFASSELQNTLALPIVKDGSVSFRSDFDFYLVFSNPLEETLELLEATTLEFKTSGADIFYVYKCLKKEFDYDKPYSFSFTTNMQLRYLLIADGIAQSL